MRTEPKFKPGALIRLCNRNSYEKLKPNERIGSILSVGERKTFDVDFHYIVRLFCQEQPVKIWENYLELVEDKDD